MHADPTASQLLVTWASHAQLSWGPGAGGLGDDRVVTELRGWAFRLHQGKGPARGPGARTAAGPRTLAGRPCEFRRDPVGKGLEALLPRLVALQTADADGVQAEQGSPAPAWRWTRAAHVACSVIGHHLLWDEALREHRPVPCPLRYHPTALALGPGEPGVPPARPCPSLADPWLSADLRSGRRFRFWAQTPAAALSR